MDRGGLHGFGVVLEREEMRTDMSLVSYRPKLCLPPSYANVTEYTARLIIHANVNTSSYDMRLVPKAYKMIRL